MSPDRLYGIGPARGGQARKPDSQKPAPGAFADALRAESERVACGELKVSQHARARLQEASISLGPARTEQINRAIDRAAQKGARESLLLMNDLALVVSIQNRTIITAIGIDRIKENVFTNIDSAVILDGLDLNEGARGALYQSHQAAQGGHERL